MTKKLSDLTDEEALEIIERVLEEQGLRKKGQVSDIKLTLDAPGARQALGRCYALLLQWGREARDCEPRE